MPQQLPRKNHGPTLQREHWERKAHHHKHTHSLTYTNTYTHLPRQTHIYTLTHIYTHTHSSAEHILASSTWLTITNKLTHIDKHTHTHTHTDSFTHRHTYTHIYTHKHRHTLTHGGTCIKSVNIFVWGIFGSVWKGRGGGQELSAEVIRAPDWGSWNPLFDQSFCFKHVRLFLCCDRSIFRWFINAYSPWSYQVLGSLSVLPEDCVFLSLCNYVSLSLQI